MIFRIERAQVGHGTQEPIWIPGVLDPGPISSPLFLYIYHERIKKTIYVNEIINF